MRFSAFSVFATMGVITTTTASPLAFLVAAVSDSDSVKLQVVSRDQNDSVIVVEGGESNIDEGQRLLLLRVESRGRRRLGMGEFPVMSQK